MKLIRRYIAVATAAVIALSPFALTSSSLAAEENGDAEDTVTVTSACAAYDDGGEDENEGGEDSDAPTDTDSTAYAEDICGECSITADGETAPASLTDDSHYTYFEAEGDSCVIEISAERDIYALYIEFAEMPSDNWYITTADGAETYGTADFLHSYVSIARYPSDTVTLSFPFHVKISDIYPLSEGELPSWVQVWQQPYERADLMLMPTHSDDEHLFFAGILPYCAANGIKAQVVYMVNHNDSLVRPHELLNGLWEAGVTHYPVISEAPDLYCLGLSEADSVFSAAGYSHDFFVAWQVENLRRFKPLAVVEHAENGEYGHGAHMLNCATMKEAVELSADPLSYSESAEEYGVWELPKLYIHVYSKHTLTLNWDDPLEYFGGRTAFNVSQDAYRCHRSQQIFTSLSDWLYGEDGVSVTAASQIGANSPCRYGLYRSTVGDDVQKNSFFENLTLYPDEKAGPSAENKWLAEASRDEQTEQTESEALPETDVEAPDERTSDDSADIAVDGAEPTATAEIYVIGAAAVAVIGAALIVAAVKKKRK